MKIVIRVLKYTGLLAVVLLVAGSVYQMQASSIDRVNFPPPGELFLVDGLEMHLDCRGHGEPTVILEAGLTSGSASWGLVHDTLSEVTQICAYDRAGMDWSEPAERVINATTVATRLHTLLSTAELKGTQILLGMSAGGVFVREYYARFPDQVVGMVLVDSSHEQQGDRLPKIGGSDQFSRILSLCSWLQPIGVIRGFGLLDSFLDQYELPEKMSAIARANAYQSHTCSAMLLEADGFQNEVFDVDPPASLGTLPLSVLSQGKAPQANAEFGLTLEDATKMAEVWDVLQNELTALSSVGQRSIASASGHVIQLEQPQIVIDKVTQMVRNYRSRQVDRRTK